MTSTLQQSKNAVTLKGSATLVSEFFNYGINSILYQVQQQLHSLDQISTIFVSLDLRWPILSLHNFYLLPLSPIILKCSFNLLSSERHLPTRELYKETGVWPHPFGLYR